MFSGAARDLLVIRLVVADGAALAKAIAELGQVGSDGLEVGVAVGAGVRTEPLDALDLARDRAPGLVERIRPRPEAASDLAQRVRIGADHTCGHTLPLASPRRLAQRKAGDDGEKSPG